MPSTMTAIESDPAKRKSADRAAPAVHKKRRRPAAPAWSSRAVYYGRDLVAVVRRVRNGFEVRDFRRKVVGRFRTIRPAMGAVGKIPRPEAALKAAAKARANG